MAIREQLRPSNERSGNLLIGIVTCFFCVTILAGTAFFVLYLVLPVSVSTSWFPVAGIILIGLPWVFWILTCMYRLVTRNLGLGPSDKAPVRAATVAPASGGATAADMIDNKDDIESPGGARRVRFGGATEMASDDGRGTNGGQVGAKKGASDDNDDESSLASRESEAPLALSMC